LRRDYAPNELLDKYSDADINDDEELEELSTAARRAAEAKMTRRDRLDLRRFFLGRRRVLARGETTRAPSVTSMRAIAAPMPELLPVTSARFPLS